MTVEYSEYYSEYSFYKNACSANSGVILKVFRRFLFNHLRLLATIEFRSKLRLSKKEYIWYNFI